MTTTFTQFRLAGVIGLFLLGLPTLGAPATPQMTALNLNEVMGKQTFAVQMIDLDTDYVTIRVPLRTPDTHVSSRVTDESLASCEVVAVVQAEDSALVDVIVSYDVFNDGGYNSCDVEITRGQTSVLLQLGSEVGD